MAKRRTVWIVFAGVAAIALGAAAVGGLALMLRGGGGGGSSFSRGDSGRLRCARWSRASTAPPGTRA
jgi:hypothetical protein